MRFWCNVGAGGGGVVTANREKKSSCVQTVLALPNPAALNSVLVIPGLPSVQRGTTLSMSG